MTMLKVGVLMTILFFDKLVSSHLKNREADEEYTRNTSTALTGNNINLSYKWFGREI